MPRPIKIGADPEFEWVRNGEFVSACHVRSGLHNRLGTDGSDNTGEIRPKPGKPGTVIRSINITLGFASKTYGRNLDMYAGSGKYVPIGGHIHFSGIEHSRELIIKLDQFITIPLNNVSDRRVRQGRYGELSEVRSQPHGWEYRSPCSWLAHPRIAGGALRIAWLLALASQDGDLNQINSWEDLVEQAKASENPSQSVWDVRMFVKTLDRMGTNNITLEQIEVFKAWKKKPRPDTQPRMSIPNIQWNTEDYNISQVKAKFDELTRGYEVNDRNVSVIGAKQDRTAQRAIFSGSSRYINSNSYTIRVRQWVNSAIGLSHRLREEPEFAARCLVKLLESNGSTDNSSEILRLVEGGR